MDRRDKGIAVIRGCAYFVLALSIIYRDARMMAMFVGVGLGVTIARRIYGASVRRSMYRYLYGDYIP